MPSFFFNIGSLVYIMYEVLKTRKKIIKKVMLGILNGDSPSKGSFALWPDPSFTNINLIKRKKVSIT